MAQLSSIAWRIFGLVFIVFTCTFTYWATDASLVQARDIGALAILSGSFVFGISAGVLYVVRPPK